MARYHARMSALSPIQAGLQAGFRAFEAASERVVQAPTGNNDAALALSEILAARLQVRSGAAVARVSSDTLASLIDILA